MSPSQPRVLRCIQPGAPRGPPLPCGDRGDRTHAPSLRAWRPPRFSRRARFSACNRRGLPAPPSGQPRGRQAGGATRVPATSSGRDRVAAGRRAPHAAGRGQRRSSAARRNRQAWTPVAADDAAQKRAGVGRIIDRVDEEAAVLSAGRRHLAVGVGGWRRQPRAHAASRSAGLEQSPVPR